MRLVNWCWGCGTVTVGRGGCCCSHSLHQSVGDDLLDSVDGPWGERNTIRVNLWPLVATVTVTKDTFPGEVLTVHQLPGLALDMQVKRTLPVQRKRPMLLLQCLTLRAPLVVKIDS